MPYTNAKNPGSEPRSIISIIIVTYNAQPTIQRTLNSILGQTYKNTEIIIGLNVLNQVNRKKNFVNLKMLRPGLKRDGLNYLE